MPRNALVPAPDVKIIQIHSSSLAVKTSESVNEAYLNDHVVDRHDNVNFVVSETIWF